MQVPEEIAIVGIGCRFPGGAATPAAFWNLLQAGIDATCDVPEDRWSLRRFHDADPATPGKVVTARGGFLREDIRQFDARFFGISPREAAQMDPQQRLLLEVAWEALEHAGIVPGDLRGSATGVFTGGFTIDNKIHLLNALNREAITSHTAVSATLGMLANRLSYVYDLRGPSITSDTACSSSMVALHLAVQSLRRGECEAALACGVNLMFRPAYTVAMSKGGFLAPDGRCKSFDARGDGYGRGEGAGVVVLKPRSAAERDGDTILALILETGMNQDGRTDGITLPSVEAQAALAEGVLARAGLPPEAVHYVEAHGTGTRAGDATEAESLSRAFARRRPAEAPPLVVGSVKSNIGHLEAAAGIAAVIKTTLALKHRKIPASLHFLTPPESIDLAAQRLDIPTRTRPWPEAPRPVAAVNSFGYGGTNAHALLAGPPAPVTVPPRMPDRPVVVPVSARSDASLIRQLKQLHQFARANPRTALSDLAYTAGRRRSHHPFRAAVVAEAFPEVRGQLRNFFAGDPSERVFVPGTDSRVTPKLAFVYTGMGPQSRGMGAGLIASDPVAARAFEDCEAIWTRLTGGSLRPLFADTSGAPMHDPADAQPANFVTQVMLTEVLRAHGLRPASVVGHSTGEIAAAWAAGVLDLEAALRVTWHRCRLQQTCLGHGRMMAVGQPEGATRAELPAELDIAAVNGPRSVTLAGPEAALAAYGAEVEARDGFARMLNVGVAYHSRQMDHLRDDFLASLEGLAPAAPVLPLYSSVTGARVDGAAQDAGYWWRNLRQEVRFGDAAAAMVADGHTVFLEVGPHPVLAGAIGETLAAAAARGICVASLRRGRPEPLSVASAVAEIYAHGVDLDWQVPCPAGNRLPLLGYPWDREEYWSESELSRRDRLGTDEHPMVARAPEQATPTWDGELTRGAHGFLADHAVRGEPVFPAAGYVELALAARPVRGASTLLEDLAFETLLPSFTTPVLRLHLDDDSGTLRVFSRERAVDARWTRNATARIRRTPAPPRAARADLDAIRARCPDTLDTGAFYDRARTLGLEYGSAFRCLREARIGAEEALFHLRLASTDTGGAGDYYAHPVLLDGALQGALALELAAAPGARTVSLPVGIRELRSHARLGTEVWCHLRRTGDEVALSLHGPGGETLLELSGLRTRALPVAALRGRTQDQLLYTTRWESPRVTRLPVTRETSWLVFADGAGVAAALQERAAETLMTLVTVHPGAAFARLTPTRYEVRRGNAEDMSLLMAHLGETRLAGVIYLWPLDMPDLGNAAPTGATGQRDVTDLLHLVQGLGTRGGAELPPVTVCCAGSQIVAQGDTGADRPGQHAVWSAVRAAQLELPQLPFRLLDLPSRSGFVAARRLLRELHIAPADTEIAYRGDLRFASRVVPLGAERYPGRPSRPGMPYRFDTVDQGGTRRRGLVGDTPAAPGTGEVRVALHWQAFGEEDRARIRRHAAPELPPLALRCTGRVTAVGADVAGLSEGDWVVVLAPQARLASHAVLPAAQVLPYPETVRGEDDRGALADLMTAHHALHALGGLATGAWVLLHPAETGIGLAAVTLCKAAGARVIATATSAARREALQAAGCDVVSDAQSLAFRDAVDAATGGCGADLALCALGGEMRAACFGAMRPGGVLVDCARDENAGAQLPLRLLDRGVRYLRADLDRVFAEDRAAGERALAGVAQLLRKGEATPVPVTTYHPSEIEKALVASVEDSHVGRLILGTGDRIVPLIAGPATPLVHPEGAYLVTGGFGGIGIETVRWLVAQGARHVAVLSRSGPRDDAARALLRETAAQGVTLVHEEVDIADAAALARALAVIDTALPPVRGVIHAAGLLRDGDIERMRAEAVAEVMAAKATGALNLHMALAASPMDFFVCYGSIAGSLGNVGQFNYAAANGFLEGLVLSRRAQGLPGTCINWGPVGGTGMAAEARITERLARAGLAPIPMEMVFEVLTEALRNGWVTFDAADIDWATWGRQVGPRDRLRLSRVLPEAAPGTASSATRFREMVFGLGPAERAAAIFALVVEVTASVLRLGQSQIDATANLADLGTDSIMAAEIRQALAVRTDVSLRTVYLTRGPALADIAGRLEHAIVRGETVYSG